MKKLISFLFMILVIPAQSAQVVNVEYIHNAIAQKWDITVPYNSELTNPRVVANMKYLLTTVDVANEMLNGEKTTDYGNGEYATMVAADTIATNTAVDTLINEVEKYKFIATIEVSDSKMFQFSLGAAGKFYVDWGDGTVETITRTDTDSETYSHQYASANTYQVRFGGKATGYGQGAAISFNEYAEYTSLSLSLVDISGCLGCIFSTLSNGEQPRFINTFFYTNITSIPEELFHGIHGSPVSSMFYSTFTSCYQLQSLPGGLFDVLSGAPAEDLFAQTFADGALLSIPAGLFKNIYGPAAAGMFAGTFLGNYDLVAIPDDLFACIDTSQPLQPGVFLETFFECSSLTGPSARIGGRYIYEIWPRSTNCAMRGMYFMSESLSDYDSMPYDLTEQVFGGTDVCPTDDGD